MNQVSKFLFAFTLLLSVNTLAQKQKRVGEIDYADTDQMTKRIQSKDFNSFFIGPAASDKIGDNKMLYTLSVGKHWEATPIAEIRGIFRGAFNGNGQYVSAGLGASYIPITTDISPIFGAEVGYGYANGKKDDVKVSKGGFAGGVHAGVRLFRTSSTQLEISLNYNTIFVEGNPGFGGISLGLLY
ncbi:MAG: hypothetical protein AB7H97_05925 [Pseudobdellovibrionaceae bacterium]